MAKPKRAAAGTPATVLLTGRGVPHTLHPYRHDARAVADGLSFGQEAARALGVVPERVFKTLVAELDGELVVAIVPVTGSLDLKALAAALGGKKAVMAAVPAAERATGYVAGGISPLGQRTRHRTALDRSALAHRTIYVSAGRRGLDVELAPSDLVGLLEATTADIARPG